MSLQYRHGDVFLKECSPKRITKKAKVVQQGECILAEGEVTGHAHRVDTATLYEREDGTLILDTRSMEATLAHEEHGKIALKRGTFEVIRQREYQGPEATRWVND